MLRNLASDEIAALASRKGVRKIAVENFLMTVHHNDDSQTAFANLEMDADLYKWNGPTRTAIAEGITLASWPKGAK